MSSGRPSVRKSKPACRFPREAIQLVGNARRPEVRAVESGVASIEDIDKGMVYGCGHPMGPLTLLDFVGIDTTYRIAEIMFQEYKEPVYAAPPLLRKMHLAGYHGRKTGKGFYDYGGSEPKPMNLNL